MWENSSLKTIWLQYLLSFTNLYIKCSVCIGRHFFLVALYTNSPSQPKVNLRLVGWFVWFFSPRDSSQNLFNLDKSFEKKEFGNSDQQAVCCAMVCTNGSQYAVILKKVQEIADIQPMLDLFFGVKFNCSIGNFHPPKL